MDSDDLKEVKKSLKKARKALTELKRYNQVRNDLQAYLWEVAKFGLGERKSMPSIKHYTVV